MIRVARLIVYETESQEAMDHQLGSSLPDGVKEITKIGKHASFPLTIRTATIPDNLLRTLAELCEVTWQG